VGERIGQAWVPVEGGVRLSVTLFLPDPAAGPAPCIVEALPYRKDDLTASYDPEYERLRDEFGYAVARVDLRGTGSSEGVATDEYPAVEQRDIVTVLAWLAGQDWCDGNIGMYGTSYSGFNSLQVACERPPQLKAIIAIYASDDRYTDDVHYLGGAQKWLDLVDYRHYMTPMNALPPVPAVYGEGWREEWRRRLDGLEPWLFTWLTHQQDDGYWRQGSVRPDYSRIACPVMIVAGWADGYRNISFRTVEALGEAGVPRRLLAGPWAHVATDTSIPGPRIDLVPEMVRWWDRWLRPPGEPRLGDSVGAGSDPVAAQEPVMTYFMRRSTKPSPVLDSYEGEWRGEDWPTPRTQRVAVALDARPPYDVRADVGIAAWISCAGHLPWGQSDDQRFDDAASVTWDRGADGVELLGHPTLRLRLVSSQPVAFLSARIDDVFPDGTSALVTRGLLNLTHRNGHDRAAVPLQPGVPVEVDIELDATAYAFDPGHQLRLAIAGSDWPNTMAPPRPLTLEILGGELVLPTLTGPSPYPPPRFTAGGQSAEDPAAVVWRVERDVLNGSVACVIDHGSAYDAPHGCSVTEHYSGRVTVDTRTFGQRAQADALYTLAWPGLEVSARSGLDVVADKDSFDVTVTLDVRENGEQVAQRRWRREFPRDLA
jgi:uncharacterized protein